MKKESSTPTLASAPPRWTDDGESRWVAIALGVFWVAYLLLYTLRSLLLVSPDPADNFLPRLVVAVLGAPLAWLMYRVLALVRTTSALVTMGVVVSLSIVLSTVFAVSHELIFAWLGTTSTPACAAALKSSCSEPDAWSGGVDNAINWTFLFAAWGLIYVSARNAAARWASDRRLLEQREAARAAEVRALRQQINPHFLFNCLNSLATLVGRADTADARVMIGELGAFLRYGLSTDQLTEVELSEEVDMQLRYLDLERRRFGHRLQVEAHIADDVRRTRIPAFILQPIVENAITHGVSTSAAPVRVTISAQGEPRGLVAIVVEDDAWPGEQPMAAPRGEGFGIGLRNVTERLSARYGDAASVSTRRRSRGGFRVEIKLPRA